MRKIFISLCILLFYCSILHGISQYYENDSTTQAFLKIYLQQQDSLIKTISSIPRNNNQSFKDLQKIIHSETSKIDSLIKSLDLLINSNNQNSY
ncbi:hypothetical protein J7L48_03305, partial [bacterium]|nr:hypothetical protein [bacterium]